MGELGIAFLMGVGCGCLVMALIVMLLPLFQTMADNARERRIKAECDAVQKAFDRATLKMEKEWRV